MCTKNAFNMYYSNNVYWPFFSSSFFSSTSILFSSDLDSSFSAAALDICRASCNISSSDISLKSATSPAVLLHSPLLKESLLVSFPPLSYMLKFSGSCRLP
eukprot:TRINITY_DN4670_c0_g1_i2.p1 TRINITY_DN4670_c0_g1~~TRINITY_DN4670_c0_g1_i2.p1  ORF type:complete len:101 (+),score=1.24 TRINITY_DN4670_c0_g1_i2:61-363(+)